MCHRPSQKSKCHDSLCVHSAWPSLIASCLDKWASFHVPIYQVSERYINIICAWTVGHKTTTCEWLSIRTLPHLQTSESPKESGHESFSIGGGVSRRLSGVWHQLLWFILKTRSTTQALCVATMLLTLVEIIPVLLEQIHCKIYSEQRT